MSKTPICDRWEYDTNQGGLVVPLNVAKDLETELAEANRKLAERINDDQRYLVAPLCNAEKALDDYQAELAEARAENAKLRKLLATRIEATRLDEAIDQLAEARAEIESKNKLIEQMREAISDVLRHAEPPQHDIRGCMRANCWWCQVIRVRDAALSAAERGEE